jgi:hypothetical protein
MRARNFLFILAFLVSSTHVVVDHSGGRHRDVVFIPHASAFHLQANADHHEPSGADDPGHHHADTHTHVEWYTPAGRSDIPRHSVAPVVTHHVLWTAIESPVLGRTDVGRSGEGPLPSIQNEAVSIYLVGVE